LIALVAAGCAPLKGIRPETFEVKYRSAASVRTRVEFNLSGRSVESLEVGVLFSKASLSGSEFAEALDDSIRRSGLFAQVTKSRAEYDLVVSVINLREGSGGAYVSILTSPDAGGSSCTITVEWKLTKAGTNDPIYDEWVTTTSRASTGEALRGSRRTALALERAVRENLKEGIRRLSELKL
jgi:hypothetical protein